MITLRSNRIAVLGFAILIFISLYLFYPSDLYSSPHDPLDAYDSYEAGGIDSDHWLKPVTPSFEDDLTRKGDASCDGDSCDVGSSGKKGLPVVGGAVNWISGKLSGKNGKASSVDGAKKDQAALGSKGNKGIEALRKAAATKAALVVEDKVLDGSVLMPKLENATAKAELGRSAWKVLHLMTLRYPETPTEDDRITLKSFFHLFARLYPCGECAEEFQSLLKQYPPQTSSRKTASMWLCSVHNMINERLGKEEFDCLTLNDVYDCGCGPEGEEVVSGGATKNSNNLADKIDGVRDKSVDIKNQIKGVAEKGKEAVKGATDKVKEKVKDGQDTLNSKLKDSKPATRPLGGMNAKEQSKDEAGLGAKMQDAAAAAVAKVAKVGEEEIKPVAEKVEAVKGKVAEKVEVVKDQVAEKAGGAKDKVVEKVGAVKDQVIEQVTDVAPKGKEVVAKVEEKVAEATSGDDESADEENVDEEEGSEDLEYEEQEEEEEEEEDAQIPIELSNEDAELEEDDSDLLDEREEGNGEDLDE